jgi:hypothetical protein
LREPPCEAHATSHDAMLDPHPMCCVVPSPHGHSMIALQLTSPPVPASELVALVDEQAKRPRSGASADRAKVLSSRMVGRFAKGVPDARTAKIEIRGPNHDIGRTGLCHRVLGLDGATTRNRAPTRFATKASRRPGRDAGRRRSRKRLLAGSPRHIENADLRRDRRVRRVHYVRAEGS